MLTWVTKEILFLLSACVLGGGSGICLRSRRYLLRRAGYAGFLILACLVVAYFIISLDRTQAMVAIQDTIQTVTDGIGDAE